MIRYIIVTVVLAVLSGCGCPEFVYECDKEQSDKANAFIEKCLQTESQKNNSWALQNCTSSAQEIFCSKKRIFK